MKTERLIPFCLIVALLLLLVVGCLVLTKNEPYLSPGRILEQVIEDMPIVDAQDRQSPHAGTVQFYRTWQLEKQQDKIDNRIHEMGDNQTDPN